MGEEGKGIRDKGLEKQGLGVGGLGYRGVRGSSKKFRRKAAICKRDAVPSDVKVNCLCCPVDC
jgi:hypothetical protein